jgi:transposase
LTQDWITTQRHWLQVEWLPPYAPELNPVEYLWSHLNATYLANFAPDDLVQLEVQVREISICPPLPGMPWRMNRLFSDPPVALSAPVGSD